MNPVKSNKNTEETGPDLKAVREEKGLTLKEISHRTRISVSVLDAIEKKEFQKLPEPVYSKAFIKSYAQTLDIESEKLLSLYNGYLEELEASKETNIVEEKSLWSGPLYKIFAWVGVALFVSLVIFIIFSGNHKETLETAEAPSVEVTPPNESIEAMGAKPQTQEISSQITKENADTQTTDEGKPDTPKTEDTEVALQTEDSEQTTTQQAEPAIEDKPYTLDIEATELSWLEIIEDYNPPYEVLLRPGEKLTRKAREKFIVFIGNAGGVNVKFQGKSIGPLGEHGKVIRLILPGHNVTN